MKNTWFLQTWRAVSFIFVWEGEGTWPVTLLTVSIRDFHLQYMAVLFFPHYYPFIRRTWTQSVAVIMWVGGRWCSAAWGRKIGQSCWTVYSCSSLQREAPGRPEPGAWRGAGVGGRQLAELGRRGVAVGKSPVSPPCKWRNVERVKRCLCCSPNRTKVKNNICIFVFSNPQYKRGSLELFCTLRFKIVVFTFF